MLTVKPVYRLLNVPDDLKCATNKHMTPFTHFQGMTKNIYGFGRSFLPVHLPYFYLSVFIFIRPNPNDGWTGQPYRKGLGGGGEHDISIFLFQGILD